MEDRTDAFDGPQQFAGSDKAANVLITSALVQMAGGRTPEQAAETMRVLGMTGDGDAISVVVSVVAEWAVKMATAAPRSWPRRMIGPLAELIEFTAGRPTRRAEAMAAVVVLLAGGMAAPATTEYLVNHGADPTAASQTTERAVKWVRVMMKEAEAAVHSRSAEV